MSRQRQSSQRKQPPPPGRRKSTAPILYIVVVSIMVFSLIIAGLAAVDWSALFPTSSEPTPDYSIDQIALQQTAVAQNTDDADAQVLLASMLANSGRMQEAIPVYEEAIRLDPENTRIRLDFARSLQSNGMNADAEAQFLRVLELNPDDHTAHYYLGRLYLDWQPRRLDEAILHLQRVIEIAPGSFLAEQATGVLNTLNPATPTQYHVTPISSPTYEN